MIKNKQHIEPTSIDIDFKSYYFHYTKDYVEFLSIKNDIPLEEATKLFGKGWNVFGERGFGSGKFRDFTTFFSDAFAFKHGNSKDEIYNTYRFHALIDFFRILSYPIMDTERDISLYTEMVNYLASRYNNTKEIVIVDYGCGLAHITVTLCKLLKKVNIRPKLVCIDIDRFIFKEFLEFIANKYDYDYEFIDVNEDNPFPTIPKFDLIQVKDVLEHIYEPEKVIDNINDSIKDNGIVSATTDDEGPELMHVSRDLQGVRDKLDKYGFKTSNKSWFNRGYIYQK